MTLLGKHDPPVFAVLAIEPHVAMQQFPLTDATCTRTLKDS
jgi:hypothetical protein